MSGHLMSPRTAGPDSGVDVVVVEDVWGEPFETLAGSLRIRREPQAWAVPEILPDLLAGARALVVRNRTQVSRKLLNKLPELQVIARAGVGLDNIDLAAAEESGVVVVAALGANAASVAEFTVGAAVAVARGLVSLDRATRGGAWERVAGRELAGATWSLLGLGATGRRVAALARALDMEVIAHDPFVSASDPAIPAGVRLATLEHTVQAADVLSIHVPATDKTHGLLDADLLSRLRPGAILVSVGRGEVVDEDALANALESGRLSGAALDVRTVEPPQGTGRLERLDNVLFTPHIAGITTQSQHRIADMLATDIRRVLAGEPARYAVGAARPCRMATAIEAAKEVGP